MARLFTAASSERINLSLGNTGAIVSALTVAAILNPSSDGAGVDTIISMGTTGTRWRFQRNGSEQLVLANSVDTRNSTTTFTAADGWACVVCTKTAGIATPRAHIYKYTAGTWVHENMSGGTINNDSPATSNTIGSTSAGADFWDGDLAVIGAWNVAFTDAQCETLAYSLKGWWNTTPVGLWILDQATTSMNVNDVTGGGANQSGITGTAVSTVAVPVFTYGVSPISPHIIMSNLTTTGFSRVNL